MRTLTRKARPTILNQPTLTATIKGRSHWTITHDPESGHIEQGRIFAIHNSSGKNAWVFFTSREQPGFVLPSREIPFGRSARIAIDLPKGEYQIHYSDQSPDNPDPSEQTATAPLYVTGGSNPPGGGPINDDGDVPSQ